MPELPAPVAPHVHDWQHHNWHAGIEEFVCNCGVIRYYDGSQTDDDEPPAAEAQRDRLRAAPSVEELAKALHAADIAMLSGEGRPSDYIRWAEQVRAALTDDPEGET